MKNNNNILGTDQLIQKLKKEDAYYLRLVKTMQYVYWGLIPIYLFLAVRDYYTEGVIQDAIGSLLYMFSLIIFAIIFRQFYKEYNNVDYAMPVLQMLKKAERRYQPFSSKTAWLYVGVLLMDFGIYFNTSLGYTFWEVQLYYGGMIVVATIIGYIVYLTKYKTIRDNAKRLIREIENG
ncbi:MAG: hypothetical protein PF489_06175 [Salinivirgaceae bacterium]|jgi:hypothetical protein|nr:hypothetical protein [Salinivirgaceae bacterium]